MLRRLHHEQPESFAFTPANQAWAEAQITKYPEGRQASAVIPLLWRAQEQDGWLSRPAIEEIAKMLDLAYIRVLEVATFYFMFQLQPVGAVAHVQICGTTSCMICGAEDLMAVCRDEIAAAPHTLSADGKFSWEEVECLGACANAPMAQIGKDYYEDLTADSFRSILKDMAAGNVPRPGSQNGRFTSEPASGLTALTGIERVEGANASVALADRLGDTIKRIDGTEVPLTTPWQTKDDAPAGAAVPGAEASDQGADDTSGRPGGAASGVPAATVGSSSIVRPTARLAGEEDIAATKGSWTYCAPASAPEDDAEAARARAEADADTLAAEAANISDEDAVRPEALDGPRGGTADDLKMIKGVGPKLEALLHSLGFYHFDQVATWTAAEIAWVDRNLDGFKGRVVRDRWVAQARILAAGGQTEFSQRAKY